MGDGSSVKTRLIFFWGGGGDLSVLFSLDVSYFLCLFFSLFWLTHTYDFFDVFFLSRRGGGWLLCLA